MSNPLAFELFKNSCSFCRASGSADLLASRIALLSQQEPREIRDFAALARRQLLAYLDQIAGLTRHAFILLHPQSHSTNCVLRNAITLALGRPLSIRHWSFFGHWSLDIGHSARHPCPSVPHRWRISSSESAAPSEYALPSTAYHPPDSASRTSNPPRSASSGTRSHREYWSSLAKSSPADPAPAQSRRVAARHT